MRTILYLLLCLLCSCSAKRKLTESSSTKLQRSSEVQHLQQKKAVIKSYQLGLDSGGHRHWIKLYPKETFVINEQGFVGAADSVVWYGQGQQLRKREAWQAERQNQLLQTRAKHAETQSIKAQQKAVAKVGTSMAWLIGCGVVIGVVAVIYRRIRAR